jgi:hypothetical protein
MYFINLPIWPLTIYSIYSWWHCLFRWGMVRFLSMFYCESAQLYIYFGCNWVYIYTRVGLNTGLTFSRKTSIASLMSYQRLTNNREVTDVIAITSITASKSSHIYSSKKSKILSNIIDVKTSRTFQSSMTSITFMCIIVITMNITLWYRHH